MLRELVDAIEEMRARALTFGWRRGAAARVGGARELVRRESQLLIFISSASAAPACLLGARAVHSRVALSVTYLLNQGAGCGSPTMPPLRLSICQVGMLVVLCVLLAACAAVAPTEGGATVATDATLQGLIDGSEYVLLALRLCLTFWGAAANRWWRRLVRMPAQPALCAGV